jgi:site-specific recombinase XerC
MNAQLLPMTAPNDTQAWQHTVVAFLAEKERRSGSRRTVDTYAGLLWPFLTRVGSPDRVTASHVLAWAHGTGASGREPSSATVGARIACLSSYYRFLIRMNIAASNPCDALERPRTVQGVARGLSAEEVRRLLAVVPDSVAGRRDRALLLTFVLTGRRRAEIIGLTAGDISVEGETAFYSYRGKGREARAPGAAAPSVRGAVRHARGRRAGIDADGPDCVALAGRRRAAGRDELDVLQPVPPLPPGRRAGANRSPHPPAYGRQTPPGRWGLDRSGE